MPGCKALSRCKPFSRKHQPGFNSLCWTLPIYDRADTSIATAARWYDTYHLIRANTWRRRVLDARV